MLGSFEDLEKDIEKFHNNVMASSDLVESLNATTEAIKSQTSTIAEQTAAVSRVSTDVPEQIASTTKDAIKRMEASNVDLKSSILDSTKSMADRIIAKDNELQGKLESVPVEMKASLVQHQQEINAKNDEYLQACSDTFDKRQQEYIDQLKDNRATLDACRKQLEEAHASFIKKAEELDLGELQRSVEMLKADVSKKLNIVTIISVLAFIAAVAGIFIK